MEADDVAPAKNGVQKFDETSSRPTSLYDNFGDNEYNEEGSREGVSGTSGDEMAEEKSPTQEYLLKTTVPQNLAAMNIAERHTPTRNSLRHSRMIVMNRTGQVRRTHTLPIIRCHKFATVLVSLQVLLGMVVCCLAVWLLIWAPNLRRRDNPHWSGLPLLASGTVGLMLLCCCKTTRPRTLQGYLINATKILSGFLSLVAGVTCMIASVFAIIHLLTLGTMTCEASSPINDTCMCRNGNSTTPIKSYHYVDLKCSEVNDSLFVWLMSSCVLNTAAAVVCLLYLYLHCSTRFGYKYSKVRTKEKEMVVFNK